MQKVSACSMVVFKFRRRIEETFVRLQGGTLNMTQLVRGSCPKEMRPLDIIIEVSEMLS